MSAIGFSIIKTISSSSLFHRIVAFLFSIYISSVSIFCLLVANKNRVLTYDQIYEKVWGDFSSGSERETIGFYIRNLRKKLIDTDQDLTYQIESIRDVGYRFQYN